MDINQVILVDENDNQTGTMEKMEAHRKALLHRAVSVFVMNSKGEWLLQRRALEKYHSAGLWTNTCCTHPYPGETEAQAASRRLMEEMGISCTVMKLFSFIYLEPLDNALFEHELDHVFLGFSDQVPEINRDEVMEYRYVGYSNLKEDVSENPEAYTAWFKRIYERVFKQMGGMEEQ
jgi:isopentenyl-diphosphate Delta-isomerase